MAEFLDQVMKNRRLLQNPYAYVEYLEEFAQIAASRRKYENPWAHVEDLDGFGGFRTPLGATWQKKKVYTVAEIEERATMIQVDIWQNRKELWQGISPSNPIDILDPSFALNLIGYDCEVEETLGQFYSDRKMIEVAGIIDGPSRQVRVSRQFPHNVRSFTLAHELGHAVLHEPGIMHRDRALNGETLSRDPFEFEADKFATFFLMPRKLICSTFKRFFLTDKFSLDEATASALGTSAREVQVDGSVTLRKLSRMLASAEQYNGRHFVSLANQFKVSPGAMAIRLEELELVSI